ncbi:MAG: XRE family transcriptional regulator [Mesorhizobium sp.]|uniref:helix-turn-helix domain-containing protein n=1 Tax=Mesorhizobium sp. TaxID=1871066 RepID=UPI000FEAA421|nr:helix-turn-helix transcriptional regulator [Mesorhizobium sp.]RWC28114.1 MAG: XRE family transcriptional regulator [Mesorhizobium sp.]TIM41794.1 MAG: helix-turn-helix transcriptional regulator [Mesorhizobium sp.]
MTAKPVEEFQEIDEFDLCNQRRAMAALNAERKRVGMPIAHMEDKSGVSMNSFYAWNGGQREPTLGCLVAVAQTLGFDVVMRRRKV